MLHYLVRGQSKRSIGFILSTAISSALEVGLAYVMYMCIELAMDTQLGEFTKYGLIFVAYIIVFMSVDYLTKYLRTRVLQHAQTKLRDDVLEQIMGLDLNAYHDKNSGDWVSLMTNDLDIIGQSYFGTIQYILPDVISLVLSLCLLVFLSWKLAAFVIVFTLIQMLIPKALSPKISNAKQKLSESAAEFTVAASEHLQGYDLLRSFHLTAQSLSALHQANRNWEEKRFKVKFFNALATTLSYGFSQVVYIGMYFFGALLVASGHMSLAVMIAITQLSVYIIGPLQSLSGDISEIVSSKEIIESVKSIKKEDESDRSYEEPDSEFSGVSLNGVSFSYGDNVILDKVSATFQKGRKYLLSGASGSGKTTVVNLLSGALKPNEGEVLLGSLDIAQIDPAKYTRIVTACSQSTFIFNDSLRNNVTLFSDQFSDEQVTAALNSVGFQYVMERYEGGLDERIGQAGQNLSGGERQRIALARLELFDTPFVIFDESFANLDADTALELIHSIIFDPERTVIFIGHQLPDAIVGRFDSVVEVKDEKLVFSEK